MSKPFIQVAAAVIECNGQYLITQRMPATHLAGYWEFPGGKRESGESLEECVQREIREELGVVVTQPVPFMVVQHEYSEKEVELNFFFCSIAKGELQSLGCAGFQWVRGEELSRFDFPPADEPVVTRLQERAGVS